jgi:hypothetical protein
MRFTKWGGKKHWTYALERLGEDESGRCTDVHRRSSTARRRRRRG